MAGLGDEVRVLGPLEVVAAGRPVALSAAKPRRLLAALIIAAGSARSVDALIDAVWDATPPASAEKLVQVYVSQLRRLLPRSIAIRTSAGGYLVEPGPWRLDATEFERMLAEARAARERDPALAASVLRRALGLWRGPAYGEFADAGFARAEAERLAELHLQAVEDRFAVELEIDRHVEVLPELRAAAARYPLRERVQAQLMRALYRSGQQIEALELYRTLRARFVDELGVEPAAELRQLHQQMLRRDAALEAVQPTARPRQPVDLPSPPNPLRGRETELAELAALLGNPDIRLVVLTGAGGTGKTRLAMEVARRAADRFAHGAAFVSLAAIRDAAALPGALAAALDVPQAAGQPLDAVIAHLRSRETLLVLDNFEQLRPAGPTLVTLLSHAPRLTILVTSRVVLHVSGEHVYPVDPLPEDAASGLFAERSRTANPRLPGDQLDGATVAELCRRLDRLPLAIELAASHIRALTPSELLSRLERRLPLLTAGPSDLPARQRTLRATLEWSFEQLSAQAAADLATLSVFAGGCALDSAAAVLDAGPLAPQRLVELVDHSLLTHSVTPLGSRYAMLETVREFAAERLAASGQADDVRRRHAGHMLHFAESLGLSIDDLARGAVKRPELAVTEQANLRAALDWAAEGDPLLGLNLMAALEQFWIAASPPEAAARLSDLLARAPDAPAEIRARALRDLGGAVEFTGDLPRAVACYEASRALYRELGDEARELRLVHRLVQQATYVDDLVTARRLLDDGLRRATSGGYRYERCELLRAKAALELACDNLDVALADARIGLQLMREIGNWPWGDASMLRLLAEISSGAGRQVDAVRYGREGLAMIVPLGDRIKTVTVLAALALIHLRAGEDEAAGLLWGGIEAEEQRSFLGLWTSRRDRYANEIGKCASEAFQRARTDGRSRSLDDLITAELDA